MSTIDVDSVLVQMRALAAQAQAGVTKPESTQASSGVDFSALLKSSINKVNESQQSAGELAAALETGDPNVELSEVMVALQKANLSFQTMLQVRNKLVTAYQEIMNMPV